MIHIICWLNINIHGSYTPIMYGAEFSSDGPSPTEGSLIEEERKREREGGGAGDHSLPL